MTEPVDPAHKQAIRNHFLATIAISTVAGALIRYVTERTKLHTGKLS